MKTKIVAITVSAILTHLCLAILIGVALGFDGILSLILNAALCVYWLTQLPKAVQTKRALDAANYCDKLRTQEAAELFDAEYAKYKEMHK